MRPPLLPFDDHTSNDGGRHQAPRPSMLGIRQSRRARRRSSARFLQLSKSNHNASSSRNSISNSCAEDEITEPETQTNDNLQELYKKAIRMNAENKINASNSWSLRLIENMDTLLEEEETTESAVNFTKASCTLDASVKIYSYRVDDVHLTSYKVLANLHRNSNKKTTDADADEEGTTDQPATGSNKRRENARGAATGSTLESNVSNLNMNKLDSAFDIDPLFSKMSKAFDEGGAKGLLLANLGVGSKGCNIVFDSCQDMNNEADDPANATTATTMRDASLVDISFFTAKLQQEDPVDTLPLVPQLASLRAEHSQLEEEGFVTEEKAAAPKQRRTTNYGVTDEEEREADRSIHQEALERSRASMGRSFVDDDSHDEEPPQHHHHDDDSNDDNNSMGMGGDLFGGDYDDDDNDGDPFAPRFSSISGRSSFAPESQRTSALLDLLSNSQALWTESSNARVYWKAPSTDNQWAGVAHWKKQRPRLAQKEVAATKSNKTPAKTPSKTPKKSSRRRAGPVAVLVDLHSTASLNHLLSSHKSSKKKVGTGWSKTTIAKHTKNENVLPLDAGIGVEQLESLFLRPTGGAIASTQHPPQEAKKTVGFAPDDYFGEDDGGDDDDGGVGFCMGPDGDNDEEEDEFFVPELDDVRKVATIRVGYATVAKKVDVKRLKNELWDEVRTQIDEKQKDDLDDDDQESVMEEEEPKEEASVSDLGLSFQKAVQDMEHAKSQPDVTLPFYFICMLHLANEKGLRLDSQGLDDFIIHAD